jgi:hypothetical protein
MMLFTGVLVGALALLFFLVAVVVDQSARKRTTLYWLAATLASPAAILAVFAFG